MVTHTFLVYQGRCFAGDGIMTMQVLKKMDMLAEELATLKLRPAYGTYLAPTHDATCLFP